MKSKYVKNTNKVKHEKYKDEVYSKKDLYYLIPLVLLVVIVPLIVRLKVITLSGASYDFWDGSTENFDFFSYYKMVYIIIFTVLALVALGIKVYKEGYETINKTYYYVPMTIYSLFVILSTIISKYKGIALGGFVDRYEGMYVLLAYMLILFVTMNLLKTERQIKVLLCGIFILILVNCTIGMFQFIGFDLWKSAFGKSLMLSSKYQQYADSLNFNFKKYEIYSTLYNSNYVGSLMGMLFPMSVALLLLLKNKWYKIVSGIMSLLTLINLVGSNARSGILGCGIAFIVLIIMLNKYIAAKWKFFVTVLALIFIILIGLNFASKGSILKRVNLLINDTKILMGITKSKDEPLKYVPLKKLEIINNEANIITDKEDLKIVVKNNNITFEDNTQKPINLSIDNNTGKITLLDNRYKDYNIVLGDINGKRVLQLTKDIINLNFALSNNVISLVDNKGKEISLTPVQSWGFKGIEKLGSERFYIWSRAIPLLKNTKIIGYGPDTFAIYFPQNELIWKLYIFEDINELVDKPHNFYLQTAINTGIVSLFAELAIFIMYFLNSVKLYIRSKYDDFNSIAGLSMFVAVCGYLITAMFNDSIVSVAPVFWVILGTGIAVNRIVKKSLIDSFVEGKNN